MRLRSVALTNIRSYTNATLTVPDGITLLSGDIGSGKSTLLLAVEFALFGIQRGEYPGAALLRHGARTGSVTLTLDLDGREVAITRSLKRTATSVGQDQGSIAVDGVETSLTAQELKARILALLHYPPGLLTKGKGLLYRYTVYTPQEAMKAILTERAEDRVETLRQLFDIEKYRRVRDNALTVLRELRREETDRAARIEELDRDLADAQDVAGRLAAATRRAAEERRKAEAQAAAVKELETGFAALDKERFAHEERKAIKARAEQKAASIAENIEREERAAAELGQRIAETEKHLTPADADDAELRRQLATIKEHEARLAEKRRAIAAEQAKHQALIHQAHATTASIAELATCPTCEQAVDAAHKDGIAAREGARVREAEAHLAGLATLLAALDEKDAHAAKRRAEAEQKLVLVEATKAKLANLEEQRQKRAVLAETITRYQEQLAEAKEAARATVAPFDREAHAAAAQRLKAAQEALANARVSLAQAEKDAEAAEKEAARATEKRAQRAAYHAELTHTRQVLAWTNKTLLGVAGQAEKALFGSVYALFNEYFREWFATLLEDEALTVRLDTDFAPVITQDGYETTVEHLSGGERTSVALAYRLALNKVVNEFLGRINTRDLLILDEPTDGFSREQLARLRDVLDQLRLKQIIIVSHEAELEGYVDTVIRVAKHDHESRIT